MPSEYKTLAEYCDANGLDYQQQQRRIKEQDIPDEPVPAESEPISDPITPSQYQHNGSQLIDHIEHLPQVTDTQPPNTLCERVTKTPQRRSET